MIHCEHSNVTDNPASTAPGSTQLTSSGLVSKKNKRKISANDVEGEICSKKMMHEADIKINRNAQQRASDFAEPRRSSDSTKARKRSFSELGDSWQSSSKMFKTIHKNSGDEERHKKVRKRMKRLLQTVLDQMEFYFSDSNLNKDRFLRKIIDSSPDAYVDLAVFEKFNKLQSLHKEGVGRKILTAAIRNSRLLQLNEDKTKVKRVVPLKEFNEEETNSRTVYVEHLPSHANHSWIRSIFSQCGQVLYVSLPVYKTTKMVKGFAFVEFETPEEAAKACSLLNNPMPAKSEEKAGKFPKGNKTLNRLQKLAPVTIGHNENQGDTEENQLTEQLAVSKKKKKKGSKKRKSLELSSDDNKDKSVTMETESTEERQAGQTGDVKKKKKKKKKKQHKDQEEGNSSELKHEAKAEDGVPTEVPTEVSELKIDSSVAGNSLCDGLLKKEILQDSSSVKILESSKRAPDDADVKKKNKRKRKSERKLQDTLHLEQLRLREPSSSAATKNEHKTTTELAQLSRKERKRLRQEDIRRKKLERELANSADVAIKQESTTEVNNSDEANTALKDMSASGSEKQESRHPSRLIKTDTSRVELDNSIGDGGEPSSILKLKKGPERKKVEFNPVPVTNEFVKGRELRKRKKLKKEKLHLRVISKKDWLSLKAEYIAQQKSHMAALKESLRELRLQENQGRLPDQRPVDLEDVFGTKRLKPSQDLKLAHVESLKFIPNVIVQWKCSHEIHRDKIRTMFKELAGDSIAYIDAKEEAKFGYIRFKDEASAEEFTKLSRCSTSFMARILPADQQEEYWKKANEDKLNKLGRKKREKGVDKIARKVFERNKATFSQKSSHIVFDDDNNENNQVVRNEEVSKGSLSKVEDSTTNKKQTETEQGKGVGAV